MQQTRGLPVANRLAARNGRYDCNPIVMGGGYGRKGSDTESVSVGRHGSGCPAAPVPINPSEKDEIPSILGSIEWRASPLPSSSPRDLS